MRNLIVSGLHRLWNNKVFWIGMAVVFIMSVTIVLLGGRNSADLISQGYKVTLDKYYFGTADRIGLFIAIFAGLFLGTEYSEGTIRNKVVVGHTRSAIYASNYVVCLVASECFVAAWLIGGLAGIPFLGVWDMGVSNVIMSILLSVLSAAALTGIFTMLCMLLPNRAIASVLALLLALALSFAANMILSGLEEPEMTSEYVATVNGIQMTDPHPNPLYLSGVKRDIYEFLRDFLPSGQALQVRMLDIEKPFICMAYSVVVTIITLFSGIAVFRRKDLK